MEFATLVAQTGSAVSQDSLAAVRGKSNGRQVVVGSCKYDASEETMTEHKPHVGSASHCACAEYDGYYSKYCPIHGSMPDMNRIIDEMNRLVEGLKWIAQQPCTMDCEEASEDTECIETSACCTEWCLSCYAKGVLKGMPVRLNNEEKP